MRRFEVYELLNRNGEKRRILDLNDDQKIIKMILLDMHLKKNQIMKLIPKLYIIIKLKKMLKLDLFK